MPLNANNYTRRLGVIPVLWTSRRTGDVPVSPSTKKAAPKPNAQDRPAYSSDAASRHHVRVWRRPGRSPKWRGVDGYPRSGGGLSGLSASQQIKAPGERRGSPGPRMMRPTCVVGPIMPLRYHSGDLSVHGVLARQQDQSRPIDRTSHHQLLHLARWNSWRNCCIEEVAAVCQ